MKRARQTRSSKIPPTRWGSELDKRVARIKKSARPIAEKTLLVFSLLESLQTPPERGGKTALEVAINTIARRLRLPQDDPDLHAEITAILYVSIPRALEAWEPDGGLSFLSFLINAARWCADAERRHSGREITLTELFDRDGDGSEMEEDRTRLLAFAEPAFVEGEGWP